MSVIRRLTALEILDSRGRPTVQATCELASGARGTVSVPSGASTGAAEALELRDGDPARYRGLGCRTAVAHVNGPLNDTLNGRDFDAQAALDRAMLDLDGTPEQIPARRQRDPCRLARLCPRRCRGTRTPPVPALCLDP